MCGKQDELLFARQKGDGDGANWQMRHFSRQEYQRRADCVKESKTSAQVLVILKHSITRRSPEMGCDGREYEDVLSGDGVFDEIVQVRRHVLNKFRFRIWVRAIHCTSSDFGPFCNSVVSRNRSFRIGDIANLPVNILSLRKERDVAGVMPTWKFFGPVVFVVKVVA